jgi:hypothetical protein
MLPFPFTGECFDEEVDENPHPHGQKRGFPIDHADLALGRRVAGAAVGAARKNSEVELWPSQREAARRSTDVKDGGPIEAIVEDMKRLEARKTELKDRLANAEEPPPLLHPNMAEIYRQRIAALYENLQNDDEKAEAAEVFRTLVDQVTLVPDEAELAIVLRGDLAAILRFAANKKNRDVLSEAGVLGALPPSILATSAQAPQKGRPSRFGNDFAKVGCCVSPQPPILAKAIYPEARTSG